MRTTQMKITRKKIVFRKMRALKLLSLRNLSTHRFRVCIALRPPVAILFAKSFASGSKSRPEK